MSIEQVLLLEELMMAKIRYDHAKAIDHVDKMNEYALEIHTIRQKLYDSCK